MTSVSPINSPLPVITAFPEVLPNGLLTSISRYIREHTKMDVTVNDVANFCARPDVQEKLKAINIKSTTEALRYGQNLSSEQRKTIVDILKSDSENFQLSKKEVEALDKFALASSADLAGFFPESGFELGNLSKALLIITGILAAAPIGIYLSTVVEFGTAMAVLLGLSIIGTYAVANH